MLDMCFLPTQVNYVSQVRGEGNGPWTHLEAIFRQLQKPGNKFSFNQDK